jgi:hypothetical protein
MNLLVHIFHRLRFTAWRIYCGCFGVEVQTPMADGWRFIGGTPEKREVVMGGREVVRCSDKLMDTEQVVVKSLREE